MCIPFKATVNVPSIQMVGDGPIDSIIRNIIDATNVRIPDGLGTVNILVSDNSITVHIIPDICGLHSRIIALHWLVGNAKEYMTLLSHYLVHYF